MSFNYPSSGTPKYGDTPPLEKERGGCLTLWLVVSTLLSFLAVGLLFNVITLMSDRPDVLDGGQQFGVILLAISIVVYLVSLFGIWSWKKWGVYGVVLGIFLSPIAEFVIGSAVPQDCIAPLVQIGILYYLVQSRWHYFD